MYETTIELTSMAHGGVAMGREATGRPVFIPYTIPGETVRARVTSEKRNFARAELIEVLEPSPSRVEQRCPHFTVCGGCHFQHMRYERQLKAKAAVVGDQLKRIGGIKDAPVRPTIASPEQWAYRIDVSLSPIKGGGLGFWSPTQRRIMPIDECHIIRQELMTLWQDIDLFLPGLRKLVLRIGDDGALLAALEVDDVEPPELSVDFPVSVAMVLPDRTAASLIGDHYLVQRVKDKDFRVSPGCFFQPSPAATESLIDTVMAYAAPGGSETVLETHCGVGMLTAFLSASAHQLLCVEANPDAIDDAAVNLDDRDNVSLFQGRVEEVVPALEIEPEVVVVNPPSSGLTTEGVKTLGRLSAERFIYVSSDVATLARDGKQLGRAGYRLVEVQPVDVTPQSYQIDSVSLWQRFK